jgi:ATP-dependent RNA helicase DeaD
MESFSDLSLSPLLMKSINEMGYEKPTPIQAQALPILLGDTTDFLGLAATGTGKTAAFAIPMLEKLDTSVRKVQGLILCPTRELALQVAGQIDLLGKHMGVRALPIYGGSPYGDQIRGLKQGAMVVVGTPGRVVDHLKQGTLNLSELQVLILDEADEMISMGFKDDLEVVLSSAPRDTSSIWLFSATMSGEVRRVADEYLRDPQQVQVNRTEVVPDTIDQIYYRAHESDKPEILCKLIDAADDFYGIIFCQTKALVVDLTQYMKDRGYRTDCLHGDMDQNARERTMQAFRDRKVNVLVCTDVASRGLDVKDITHVINYSIPRELDNYVHRIGRTARSGKTGFAMSLVTASHRSLIPRIERMTKSKMREGRLPTRKEIGAKKVSKILLKFQEQTAFARATALLSPEWKTALADMSSEEIVGRFLSLSFPETFSETSPEASHEAPVSNRSMTAEGRGREARRDGGGERGGSYGNDRGPRRDYGNRSPSRNDERPSDRRSDFRNAAPSRAPIAPRTTPAAGAVVIKGFDPTSSDRQVKSPKREITPVNLNSGFVKKPKVVGGNYAPRFDRKPKAEAGRWDRTPAASRSER